MPNYEARLDISHDCPYCKLTDRYPQLRITSWDTATMHIAVVTSPEQEDLRCFEEELSSFLPYALVSHQCGGLEVVIKDRDVDPRSVTSLISKHNCWSAQPSVAEGGWEKYRVFSWDKANLSQLVSDIRANGGVVKLESVRTLGLPSFTQDMLVPVENVLNGLTHKQVEALVTALEKGYFDSPARISADELARALGLSRSTLSEHLRKAEGRLLLNVLPILRMEREEKRD